MILFTIPHVMEFANGNKILDLMPMGYSFEYVQNLLSTLGTLGIQIYLFPQLALDFIYPGFFIITNLSRSIRLPGKYITILSSKVRISMRSFGTDNVFCHYFRSERY